MSPSVACRPQATDTRGEQKADDADHECREPGAGVPARVELAPDLLDQEQGGKGEADRRSEKCGPRERVVVRDQQSQPGDDQAEDDAHERRPRPVRRRVADVIRPDSVGQERERDRRADDEHPRRGRNCDPAQQMEPGEERAGGDQRGDGGSGDACLAKAELADRYRRHGEQPEERDGTRVDQPEEPCGFDFHAALFRCSAAISSAGLHSVAMGLRVCLVTPFAWSRPHDVNEHVAGAAHELRQLGHEVTVLAPSTRAADLLAGRRALLDGDGHDVIALGPAVPTSRRSRIGVPVGVRANLSLALARGNYDVVHGFEPGLPSLSYLALRDAQAFAVATFLSPERLGYPPGKAQRERLLARLDALVATSERTAEAAAERLPGDYEVVTPGVDLELFRPGRKRRVVVYEWRPTERALARAVV